jgi:hypothetical protein
VRASHKLASRSERIAVIHFPSEENVNFVAANAYASP